MKRRPKLPMAVGVIIAALVGGLIAGHFQNRGEKNLMPTMSDAPEGSTEVAANLSGPNERSEATAPESPGEIREREAFILWRKSEAAKLDSTQVNEDLEISGIEERIKNLTPTEWKEVARQITDMEADANERVFSAYLMGQGGLNSELTESLASEVVAKPLPDPGPHPVHSLEETAAMREKSLRMLVIEEMIQQVKKDTRKRDGLDRVVRAIEDHGLRTLALRRLREEGL